MIVQNRCHLNGLTMESGVPRYVTAVSKSDTIDGWRSVRSKFYPRSARPRIARRQHPAR
jgi:hypothetical protein